MARNLPTQRVVIDLLVAEGIGWAGWYRPANLLIKWDEVQGSFMRDGQGGGTFSRAMAAEQRRVSNR